MSVHAMNAKLDAIGETPLQMNGFVCLRLYTGSRPAAPLSQSLKPAHT